MSPELFEKLKSFETKGTKGEALKFYQDTMQRFRRAGVDRDEKKRRMIVEFKDQLTKLGQEFGKNIREDIREIKVTADELKGLPPITSKPKRRMLMASTKSQPTTPTTSHL